ncbi:MAG: glutamate 5-kinase [Pseudomonadota bacterium]|jgi:glutamate 5-kinase|nr:glutamate 5-kinase [Pseudomonadota bacterium]
MSGAGQAGLDGDTPRGPADFGAASGAPELAPRPLVREARRIVVKVGSSLVTNDGAGLDEAAVGEWARQLALLRSQGKEVLMVSSGAVAEGMLRLGWTVRPSEVPALQAAAAVGQMGLAQIYESAFRRVGLPTAQILLTHDDLSDRKRYLNARSALQTLLRLGVVPIINENDTVVTDEIKVGDNDTLAALVTNLLEADLLVILTDQQGLYTADPRRDAGARLLVAVAAGDPALAAMAGGAGTAIGTGGMATKVAAARRASASGADTLIASGREPDLLPRLAAGEMIGTQFLAGTARLAARKQWLAGQLQLAGSLTLDAGAVRALVHGGRSLLPIGVVAVSGDFGRGDVVACLDPQGREIARGLANYSASQTRRIMRRPSAEIRDLLGFVEEPELVHRSNMVLR